MFRTLLAALVAVAAIVSAPAADAAVRPADAGPRATTVFLPSFPIKTTSFRYVDSWGARRPGGRRHKGTDIHAPKGAPVAAVADGVVTRMKWHRLSGWMIEIAHPGGWSSVYLHLNNDTPGTDDGEGGPEAAYAPGIEIGSRVEAGQVIAYVGDSGNAEHTVPHVHFEIRFDGEPVNPYPFLESARIRHRLFVTSAPTPT